MLALITWFEEEELKIKTINQEHQEDITKLQKISQINAWLESTVIPMIKVQPNTLDEAEENLIQYFDTNFDQYNLLVHQYIYEDEVAKNMDLSYEINDNSIDTLTDFISIEYTSGFLQFRELTMDNKGLKGIIQLIQPYTKSNLNGENNVSR